MSSLSVLTGALSVVGRQCLQQTFAHKKKKTEPVGSRSSQSQCRSRVSRRRISKLDRAAKRCAQGKRAVIVNEQVIVGFVEGDRDMSPNFVAVELILLRNESSREIVRCQGHILVIEPEGFVIVKNGPADFSCTVLFHQHICSCPLHNQERWGENRIGQVRQKMGFRTKAILKSMLTCAASVRRCGVPIPISEGSAGVGKARKVGDRTVVACGFAQKIWSFDKAVILAVSGISSKGRLSCYVAQRSFRRTHSSRCRIHFACLENDVNFCVFLPLLDTKVNL